MDKFLDRYRVTRRITLGIAIWMTWVVSVWAMRFALDFVAAHATTGMELAAIIAAVTTPVTAFGGYVFKTYSDNGVKI